MTMSPGPEPEAAVQGTDERDDAALLNAYIRGDEQAFELLVKRHFALVHAVALRRLRDLSLAEEGAQSTFIILAHKAKTLSRGVPLRAWLLTTARFVCNDVLKSQRRRQEREEPLEFHVAELTASNADDLHARELVEQALLSLPATEQACVVARFYEGCSFKEMGCILGISEDGAQKKVSRSLQKLRLYLSKQGIAVSDAVLSGWLWTYRVPSVPAGLIHSSLQVILGAAHGTAVSASAAVLAGRCLRLLARREWFLLAGRVVAVLLLAAAVGWFSWSPNRAIGSNDPQMEALGKAWSIVVLRAAEAKQTYQQGVPAPNSPQFQAYMNELQFTVTETARITAQIEAALKPAQDRQQMAEFLTVEMRETLGLDRPQQNRLFNYVLEALSKGATLKQAMKAMGQNSSAEVSPVKAFLSAKQRQVFDRVYGADGLCLFQYCKVGAG